MALPTNEFYDSLIDTIERLRSEAEPDEATFFNRPMTRQELVEYLSFQAYYEYRAAEFIGRWLTKTPEDDAFILLAQQVEDEALHYQYIMRCLAPLGVTSLDNYKPEPEWEEWIDVWYPSGSDTLERVSAHNVTGELGACQAFVEIKPRLPENVTKVFERIIPDEQFHMKLGKQLILRYCVTDDQQERVLERVKQTFTLEQHGRAAFNRRMDALGLGDLNDPVPPLG